MFFNHGKALRTVIRALGFVVVVAATDAFAQNEALIEQLRECARKDSNFQRLECFDAAAETLGPSTTKPPTPTPTPQPKAPAVQVKSKNPVVVQKKSHRPELKVSCVDKKLAVQINVDYPLPTAELSVNTRVDQADVRRERWGTSTSGGKTTTVIAPFPAQLVRDMLGAKVLEAKVMASTKLPLAFSFDIEQVRPQLEALRIECLGM